MMSCIRSTWKFSSGILCSTDLDGCLCQQGFVSHSGQALYTVYMRALSSYSFLFPPWTEHCYLDNGKTYQEMSKPFQSKWRHALVCLESAEKYLLIAKGMLYVLLCTLLRILKKSSILPFGCALAGAASEVLEWNKNKFHIKSCWKTTRRSSDIQQPKRANAAFRSFVNLSFSRSYISIPLEVLVFVC